MSEATPPKKARITHAKGKSSKLDIEHLRHATTMTALSDSKARQNPLTRQFFDLVAAKPLPQSLCAALCKRRVENHLISDQTRSSLSRRVDVGTGLFQLYLI
jgi:hypothetical protein